MVSFNENGRGQGPKRRRRGIDAKRVLPIIESLEDRRLLATSIVSPILPSSTTYTDVKSGPRPMPGEDLITDLPGISAVRRRRRIPLEPGREDLLPRRQGRHRRERHRRFRARSRRP